MSGKIEEFVGDLEKLRTRERALEGIVRCIPYTKTARVIVPGMFHNNYELDSNEVSVLREWAREELGAARLKIRIHEEKLESLGTSLEVN